MLTFTQMSSECKATIQLRVGNVLVSCRGYILTFELKNISKNELKNISKDEPSKVGKLITGLNAKSRRVYDKIFP